MDTKNLKGILEETSKCLSNLAQRYTQLLTNLESADATSLKESPTDSPPPIFRSKRCDTFRAGSCYFIRTVTHHFVGRCVMVSEDEVALIEASWVADDGRFNEAMRKGQFKEVEPYPEDRIVTLNRASFIDSSVWPHDLPTGVKTK